MLPSLDHLVKQVEQPFNIIEEFADLNARRKIILCDHLFLEGYNTFEETVKTLWRQATQKDVKKLETFLYLLKKAAAH